MRVVLELDKNEAEALVDMLSIDWGHEEENGIAETLKERLEFAIVKAEGAK